MYTHSTHLYNMFTCTQWSCTHIVHIYIICLQAHSVCTLHVTPYRILLNYRAKYLTNELSSTWGNRLTIDFEHRSLIRFPRMTGYFWAERTCAVKRGLTVHRTAQQTTRKTKKQLKSDVIKTEAVTCTSDMMDIRQKRQKSTQ